MAPDPAAAAEAVVAARQRMSEAVARSSGMPPTLEESTSNTGAPPWHPPKCLCLPFVLPGAYPLDSQAGALQQSCTQLGFCGPDMSVNDLKYCMQARHAYE